MTDVFVDTSAIYALLVEDDECHQPARVAASSFRELGTNLVTSSFVVLETVSLLQARIGVEAVRVFYADMLPLLHVLYMDEGLLHRAMEALLAASERRVSLTDWTSITLMQDRGIALTFAFDEDLARHGVVLLPSGTR
ncbi:MAG: PIN domain-containing protein [Gammaproteobacteria bacterium]|nr:PIN domain-containing protein [Gammaproteobacteria bacterium]